MFMKSILAVFLLLLCACDNPSQQQLKAEQVDGTPFVLIVRLHALPGQDEALLTLSAAVDAKVEQGELGMLLHAFDQHPNDALTFVWAEVCASSRAFEYHLQNPDLNAYLEAAGEITDAFSTALHCMASHCPGRSRP
jgi:quinol monooxygenase YgiN